MRIAHTSDWHIDHAPHSPTPSLRQRAWRGNHKVLKALLDAAQQCGADLLVHAGDAFHHGRPSPEAMMMLVDTLAPALHDGLPMVFIEGNHERLRHRAGQRTATAVLAEALSAHGEVHVVTDGPELVRLDSGLQVACLPWLDTFGLLRDADKLDEPETVQHDFVARSAVNMLARLAEQADDGQPLVATSHLTVSSAKRGAERDLTALFREPVVSAKALAELPFDYVALGHIHKPQELAERVWYSGSPQRSTFTDEPDTKGWMLVTEDAVTKRPLPARPMLTVDLTHSSTAEVPHKALVRVRLPEGQREVPEWLVEAVEDAHARIVEVKLTQPTPTATANAEDDPAPVSETDRLRAWLADHRPDVDADAAVALAAELS